MLDHIFQKKEKDPFKKKYAKANMLSVSKK